jgi:hypothetical protein
MSPTREQQITEAARRLLSALDRMHGKLSLSQNVREAQAELQRLTELPRDPRDEARPS